MGALLQVNITGLLNVYPALVLIHLEDKLEEWSSLAGT